ncbi:MAG: hypothetical protein Q8O09_04465, partial [Bacillota bacterium]|nr:hypothetical protein [Bacillota bacterium]
MFLSGFFEKLKNRQVIAYIVVGTMFLALLAQLLDLTVRQGSALADKSVQKMQRTIVLIGERGKILDRNGLPLAYDLRSYDVTFYRDPTRVGEKNRALYTDIIMKVIDIVERNGGKFSQSFSIKKGIDGVFLFDWGDISADAAERREKLWRRDMRCESDWVTPEQIYIGLRARYQIPDDMPYEKAVELLSVWQDVQLNSYKAYSPITIATGVSMNTVAEIETRGMELDGISIAESATRIYPKDETAAHIVGYMGKMYTKETDDETIKKMKEKGYSQNDFVGVSGIEATMEEELSGAIGTRQGKRVVEVNHKGKIMRELETSLPTPGNNVVLSIDLPLQKVLETALKNNIQEIRNRQEEAM